MIIASREHSKDLVRNKPDHYNVISIVEPDVQVPNEIQECSKSYFSVKFHDVEYQRSGATVPDKGQVQDAIEWGKDKDNLIVACLAGISRSAAIAYLIQCAKEKDPKSALKVLEKKHYPNYLIVRLGSEILNDSSIFREYENWMNNKEIL